MGKTAFLFPGQGAQSVGMGQELLARSAAGQKLFSQASALLGYDLAEVCFNGPAEKLDSTAVSQPAIYTASCAALAALQEEQPEIYAKAQGAAGLSLGEYTALYFAGAFSFEDGLKLVQKRGAAMQKAADAVPGAMAGIIGLDVEQVEAICAQVRGGDVLRIANYLCPKNYSISGDMAACLRAMKVAEEAGAMKAVQLKVAGAFHTPMMAPAAEELSLTLSATAMQNPSMPVYSNVDSNPHTDPESIRRTLLAQLTSSVRWEDGIRRMMADGYDEFYEIGPGRVLRGLMKRIDRKTPITGIEF